MYRFLLTRRWVGLLAAGLVVSVSCVLMGLWQVERLTSRHERNALLDRNLAAAPVAVGRLVGDRRGLAERDQYRRVEVTGEYDESGQLLVRTRPYEGQVGYYVLTPLRPPDGPGLLVNRGWVRSGSSAEEAPDVPSPPAGEVRVVARLRPSEPPSTTSPPPPGQITRIHVPTIERMLGYDVYPAYADLDRQRPTPREAPLVLTPPEPSEGPQLAYAFQWFLFAGIAIAGLVVLARREAADTTGVGNVS